MRKKTILKIFSLILLTASSLAIESCTKEEETDDIEEIKAMLDSTSSEQLRYAELNRIAKSLHEKSPTDMPLFLTEWVETHPEDPYNAYWLFMVASSYLENSKKDMGDSKPIAEYYFERIIRNYPDLLVNGQSIHFASLEHLIEISKNPSNRIFYFNRLINGFPKNVSKTEMYVRLALEYENEGEWDQALDAYTHFLEQPDASTIQIAGIPDAYANARKMVDFSNSPKDWTFDTLDALEKAVKSAITRYDWRALDSYRSKVNFFTMSWKTSESDANAQEEFSMRNFMRGNRIRYNMELDESSNSDEAYLRTTGWSTYVNVWYLYFRKVNFPVDPDKHGKWEWAGIYLGEKL
ncbi:MAG: tetratricopeptide repeat protein [Treponema sp.]|nr:tetratricopeptide repeat protein [Treponema sp.]